jgi:phosphoglycerol transferase MdoB-like AlkP superfamily enzyme
MRPPLFLKTLLRLLVFGVAVSMVFRLVLLILNVPLWKSAATSDILYAFWDRGLLFDLYVHSMLLAVPTVLLGGAWLAGSPKRWPVVTARWIYTLLFIVLVAFSCMDIPFFTQFNFRITRAALTWMDTPWQSIKEVFTTPGYFMAFLGLLGVGWLGVRLIGRFFLPLLHPITMDRPPVGRRLVVLAPTLLGLLMGMRGDWDPGDTPLTIENAYFCENPFLNQLGVNAGFSLIDSFNDADVRFMDDDKAVTNARAALGITLSDASFPFARQISFDSTAHRWNVVLIIVESLSAERMAHFGNTTGLTPFLDSLADRSLFFDHFFSAGVHTHNGVFSTLYGWPSIGDRPSMAHTSVSGLRFHGLPQVLKENGYRTLFLYVGERKFDNMGGFLPNNGFDEMLGGDDYDVKWPRTSWGVADHALYAEGLKRIDDLAVNNAPFFVTFLTIASHAGYNVPTDVPFKPSSSKSDENIYQYMDWAMSRFFAEARTRSWSQNTLFVITGDHGQAFDRTYEMPLSYHRIPLIIYAPELVGEVIDHRLGGQIDVSETVLGLLRMTHVNNTLGIDLTRDHRRFAFFSADSKLAAIDRNFYWTRVGEREQLFHWPDSDPRDHVAEHAALADSMRAYAESMVQSARWAIETKKVGATPSSAEQ